jgi:Cu(I)/Ag(I) efflux system membrane fusion protein
MHPQFKLPSKGKCPICFMDLIPMTGEGQGRVARQLVFSKEALALMDIQTARVVRRPVFKRLRMTGRIAYDERRVKTINAWVGGRLERLYVDYTGIRVRKGDPLVQIYSPELVAAQQELLQADAAQKSARLQGRGAQEMARIARQGAWKKLSLMGLLDTQIQAILEAKKPLLRMEIKAPQGGVVIEKKALEGMYLQTGTPIYSIADLSRLWVIFDAYERDLPHLYVGQSIQFTLLAMPERMIEAKISYLDPTLDAERRVVRVRAEVSNRDGFLRPAMFVSGLVEIPLNAKGRVRMAKRRSLEDALDPLVIPASAPLLTGRRAIVYVRKREEKKPTFQGREVVLGTATDDFFVVLSGLKEGEEVVTHGSFKLDSELQIQAQPSMMLEESKPQLPKRPAPPPRVDQAFRKLQKKLYDGYFALQTALAADQLKASQEAFASLAALLKKPQALRAESGILWDALRAQLFSTFEYQDTLSMVQIRERFEALSLALIALQEKIGHPGSAPIFLAYCPMAFNNRGSSWLQSRDPEIANPYFGAEMLRCGEIKQRFAPLDKKATPPKKTRSITTSSTKKKEKAHERKAEKTPSSKTGGSR